MYPSRYWALSHRNPGLMPDPEISAHLGEVLWVHGDLEAAGQIWDQALQEHPDSLVLNETVLRFNP